MDKIWFIEIEGNAEGPYNVRQLKYDPRITPDTLVWREGFSKWLPLRSVEELKEVFEDEVDTPVPLTEVNKKKPIKGVGKEELALDYRRDIPPWVIWLLIAVIIIYIIYELSNHE